MTVHILAPALILGIPVVVSLIGWWWQRRAKKAVDVVVDWEGVHAATYGQERVPKYIDAVYPRVTTQGEAVAALDPSRATLASETHRRLERADSAHGITARNAEAREYRSVDEIASDELAHYSGPLAHNSGSLGQVEGSNKAQQLESAVLSLQKQLTDEKAHRLRLPSADAQAELDQVRALIGSQPQETTVDAVMRLLGTRCVVDGLPKSVVGRLMHAGLTVEEIKSAVQVPPTGLMALPSPSPAPSTKAKRKRAKRNSHAQGP